MINTEYFREYRTKLGFSNQADTKNFFGAKDISAGVDLGYINSLNVRLEELVDRLGSAVGLDCQPVSADDFKQAVIYEPYQILLKNNILPRLNNQGRRPEQVYFSWMRGFVVSNYFLGAIGSIFGVSTADIQLIGDDDLSQIETFKRTPKADLELILDKGRRVRLEIQSGFTGVNDIKQHKVIEAKRVHLDQGISTLAVHFDLYNGQAAFILLDGIEDNSVNWITRQQMEGQTVFNIDQNFFIWRLIDTPPKLDDLVREFGWWQ